MQLRTFDFWREKHGWKTALICNNFNLRDWYFVPFRAICVYSYFIFDALFYWNYMSRHLWHFTRHVNFLLLSLKLTSADSCNYLYAEHKLTTHEIFEQEAKIVNFDGTITWSKLLFRFWSFFFAPYLMSKIT